jgi:uncharacterized protein
VRIIRRKIVVTALIAALVAPFAVTLAAYGADADKPPSEQSIRELLAVMQSHNMVDTMIRQMDGNFAAMMKQSMGARQLSEREQQITDDAHAKIQALLRQTLQWDNFEPMMIHVYQSTFTQKDVDGMTAFYKTPTGQAVISKMPMAVQQSMQAMQERIASVLPQIQQIQRDMATQMKEAREKDAHEPQGAPAQPASPKQ